jgi:hypothetical protein
MSDNRIIGMARVETQLSEVRLKIQGLSVDSPNDEVDELLRLRSVLELKLSLGQEARKRAEQRASDERYDTQVARQDAINEDAQEQRRVSGVRDRIAKLKELIADPTQPRLTEEQMQGLRMSGPTASVEIEHIRATQKDEWRKEVDKLQASMPKSESDESKSLP